MENVNTNQRFYQVTVERQHKAWDDQPRVFVVRAGNREKAIKRVRTAIASECYFSAQDGRISYKAHEVTEEDYQRYLATK